MHNSRTPYQTLPSIQVVVADVAVPGTPPGTSHSKMNLKSGHLASDFFRQTGNRAPTTEAAVIRQHLVTRMRQCKTELITQVLMPFCRALIQ